MNCNSYGDIYTVTASGRIIACLCALCGAAMIGIFVSVFVDRYQRVFNEDMKLINQKIILENFQETHPESSSNNK